MKTVDQVREKPPQYIKIRLKAFKAIARDKGDAKTSGEWGGREGIRSNETDKIIDIVWAKMGGQDTNFQTTILAQRERYSKFNIPMGQLLHL